jgi:toxin YhaV
MKSGGGGKQLVVNGWTLFAHSLFLNQPDELIAKVDKQRTKDPRGYKKKSAAKRLAAIAELAFNIIPQDPTHPEYRQGSTLGEDYKHWMRAKILPAISTLLSIPQRDQSHRFRLGE